MLPGGGGMLYFMLCVYLSKEKDVFSFIRHTRLTETTHTYQPSRCLDYESSPFKYVTLYIFFFIASLKAAFQDHSGVLHTRLLSPLGASSKGGLRDTDQRRLEKCKINQ